jgi:hypothetical protein
MCHNKSLVDNKKVIIFLIRMMDINAGRKEKNTWIM